MRSEGDTLSEISEQIKIPFESVSKMDDRLKGKVVIRKNDKFEKLRKKWELNTEGKINIHGRLLQKLLSEIENRDLSEVSDDRLINDTFKLLEIINKNGIIK
jgi:uncharacterized protein YxjI